MSAALPLRQLTVRPIQIPEYRNDRLRNFQLWSPPGTPLTERIKRMSVVNESGCWIWQGALMGRGYGKISVNRKLIGAHRASYVAFKGVIPTGLVIDHLCRTPACVNPAHLEAVSARENMLRGAAPSALLVGSTHCRHGHEYTNKNTYIDPTGVRQCKACRRNHNRRYCAKRTQP